MDAEQLILNMFKFRGKFFRMRHKLLEDMSEMDKTPDYYRYLRDWQITLQHHFDEIMPMQLKLMTLIPGEKFSWNTIARLYDEMTWKIKLELMTEPQNSLLVSPQVSVVKLRNHWLQSISIPPECAGPFDTSTTQTDGNQIAKITNNYTTLSKYIMGVLASPMISYIDNILSKEILAQFKNNLKLLDRLNSPDNLYNALIIHIILSKLSQSVRKQCAEKLKAFDFCPTWEDFVEVLEYICDVQETKSYDKRKRLRKKHLICMNCSIKGHNVWDCRDLIAMAHYERKKRLQELELCLNCLQKDHTTNDCQSAMRCRLCSKAHHTILHPDEIAISHETNIKKEEKLFSLAFITRKDYSAKHVLHPTAMVGILAADGNYRKCRAILTNTVHVNFITKKLKNKLNLTSEDANIELVDSFSDYSSSSKYATVKTSVSSLNSKFTLNVEFLETEVIKSKNKYYIDHESLAIPKNLLLADPNFSNPKSIDILLGAGAFIKCIADGVMRIFENALLLQNTEFGWTVEGVVDYCESSEDEIDKDD